jgi:hypothetical protein
MLHLKQAFLIYSLLLLFRSEMHSTKKKESATDRRTEQRREQLAAETSHRWFQQFSETTYNTCHYLN